MECAMPAELPDIKSPRQTFGSSIQSLNSDVSFCVQTIDNHEVLGVPTWRIIRSEHRRFTKRLSTPDEWARAAISVMNLSRASPEELLSVSLLPSEIVRIKPMQVEKIDWVVVAIRMQHHAVRRRACLFVADIGVAHETSMVIDGSPPVGGVPNEFATGFTAPLDFLETLLWCSR
jgi:hypothetical protein